MEVQELQRQQLQQQQLHEEQCALQQELQAQLVHQHEQQQVLLQVQASLQSQLAAPIVLMRCPGPEPDMPVASCTTPQSAGAGHVLLQRCTHRCIMQPSCFPQSTFVH
jgi:hypothetical protein